MTPDQIREAVLTRIATDSTYRSLTGAEGVDDRLTYRYEANADVTTSKPVYATYMMLPFGETRQGVLPPVFSFILWTRPEFYVQMVAVRDRLFALFDRKTWQVDGDDVKSRVVRESDIDEPDKGFIGRMLQVRVATVELEP